MTHNKSVKPFACGSLGRSALRTYSGMASPLLPDQALRSELRGNSFRFPSSVGQESSHTDALQPGTPALAQSNPPRISRHRWRVLGRAVGALVLLSLAATIPRYSGPFGGCTSNPYLTLEIGCMAWPELMQGVLVMAGIALLSVGRLWITLTALVVLALVATGGGIEALNTGSFRFGSVAFPPAELVGAALVLAGMLLARGFDPPGRTLPSDGE